MRVFISYKLRFYSMFKVLMYVVKFICVVIIWYGCGMVVCGDGGGVLLCIWVCCWGVVLL